MRLDTEDWHCLFSQHACVCAKSPQSCPTLCNSVDCSPPGSSVHGDSPGKNTEVGCHALLQKIFLTQGSNLRLLSFMSPALAGGFFITSTTWEVHWSWSRPIFLCPHWELVWFPGFPRTWAMTCFPLVCNHWKPQLNFPDSSCPFSLISSCFFWQTCLDWPSCLSDSV